MRITSGELSRAHHIVCPFCESGWLLQLGPGFARCVTCALPLLGSALETLREIVGLPDALGTHPCECGHPEMRRLPDGVYHCPACRSEVLPAEVASDVEKRHLDRSGPCREKPPDEPEVRRPVRSTATGGK